jgi:hypothetical protein
MTLKKNLKKKAKQSNNLKKNYNKKKKNFKFQLQIKNS